MSSNWNQFLDRRLAVGAHLTKEEHRLLDALMRCILGWHATEADLGERLLQERSGLHDGRSFSRARKGLVEKGLIEYVPPSSVGRGHRGLYRLLLGAERHGTELPTTHATERAFEEPTFPARVRAIDGEMPAQPPAQRPAPERARIEEGVKNGDDDGDLDELLSGFGPLAGNQRRLFIDAFRADASGFKACVAEARSAHRPAALLTALIRDNAHLKRVTLDAPPADRVQRWLEATGQFFEEESAKEVLADSFGLDGDELDEALRLRRSLRERMADRDRTGAYP